MGRASMFGKRHDGKLEAERAETLSEIHDERSSFESMVQRARFAGETLESEFLAEVSTQFDRITATAQSAQSLDEIMSAGYDADMQGQLRAYVCPPDEIEDEGRLIIDAMDEWNVPTTVLEKLRSSLLPKLKDARERLPIARSALRAIFEEHDSWSRYTTHYETRMRFFSRILAVAIIAFVAFAILCFHLPQFVIIGLFCSGAAGSCVSVISKMPLLRVALSGELESYERKILSRVSVGIIASMIGSGLLGSGFITFSIGNQTFADVVTSCSTYSASCTPLKMLVLLAVPMIFGFSERALTSFEKQFLGEAQTSSRN
jgi:hypothetical protein